MIIKICIGSACHLKGSYKVIESFKELISKNNMDDLIELKSDFCLGQCGEGVSIQIDERPVCSVSVDTLDDFFHNNIYQGVTK